MDRNAHMTAPTREQVVAACGELFTPEGVPIWMASPNRLLDGRSPDELVEAGEGQRVLDLILALCEGMVF